MQALHTSRAALDDLRAAAAQQDQADAAKNVQAEIERRVHDGNVCLKKRVALGKKLDKLTSEFGAVLLEIETLNNEAAAQFSEAVRIAPIPSERKANQRVMLIDALTGAAAGMAMASQMNAHGVGKVGISARVLWDYGTIYEETIEQSLSVTAERAEASMRGWLWSVLHPGEPMPATADAAKRTGPKHWAEMTGDESHAAALAAAGQKRETVVEDFEEDEREALAGAFAASGRGAPMKTFDAASGQNAVIDLGGKPGDASE